jgi:acyl-coenzyme A thioesterase PaaI-like protein
LQLRFDVFEEGKRVETTFLPSPKYQGWKGIVHGGIIATLLDETMAKVAQALDIKVMTAGLDIRFKNPAKVSEPIITRAEMTGKAKNILYITATALGPNGTVVAIAQGKLMRQEVDRPGKREGSSL